jgi:hypothetical protein
MADGSQTVGGTPATFEKHMRSELTRLGKVIREAGLSERNDSTIQRGKTCNCQSGRSFYNLCLLRMLQNDRKEPPRV